MNEIWANRLIAGTKKINDVPPFRLDAVKKVLRKRVENGVIPEETYDEIVNG